MAPDELSKTTTRDTRGNPSSPATPLQETNADFGLESGGEFCDAPGTQIGFYTLRERLGEGGFGTVWLADQSEPVKRSVAIKLLKPGMDSREIVARFSQERQALAVMDHPGIAKVLDAGTTRTGRPFFVMELVRGLPFNQYCDQRKLNSRTRLQLFVQVCLAVQHAHQKGVIHRDLKSSNILVCDSDEGPQPKVIDFGIAKAISHPLTDSSLHTQAGQFIGTPAYMSPEQAEGNWLDLDTRSDVYSLGVVLYQLLTGCLPFDSDSLRRGGPEAFRRYIREQDPPRPSTRLRNLAPEERTRAAEFRGVDSPRLIQLVHGDLDWIIMKSLEKDRDRRYETAQDFASDIRRYLNSEPVLARPPSTGYLMRRFVQRHRGAVAAAMAIMLTLCAALALSTTMFLREKSARNKAETAATKASQAAKLLKEMLASAGPSKAQGRDATMLREILDKTATRIGTGELASYPDVESDLRTTLGTAYEDLLEFDRAYEQHKLALQIRRRTLSSHDPLIADSLYCLASACDYKDDLTGAQAALREAIAINNHCAPNRRNELADCRDLLGWILYRQMDLEAAQREVNAAIAVFREDGSEASEDLIRAMNTLGTVLLKRGRFLESESVHRETLSMMLASLGPNHPKLVTGMNNLCHTLVKVGKFEEVEKLAQEALILAERITGKAISDCTDSLHKALAEAKASRGDFAGAIADLEVAVSAASEMYGADHRFTNDKRSLLAQMQVAASQFDAAAETLRLARAGKNSESAENSLFVAEAELALAKKDYDAAIAAARSALDEVRPEARQSVEILEALEILARINLAQGNRDEARALLAQAIEILNPDLNQGTPLQLQLQRLWDEAIE